MLILFLIWFGPRLVVQVSFFRTTHMGGLEIWWTSICVGTVPLPVVCSNEPFLQPLVMGRIKKPLEPKVGGFQIRGGGSRRWVRACGLCVSVVLGIVIYT